MDESSEGSYIVLCVKCKEIWTLSAYSLLFYALPGFRTTMTPVSEETGTEGNKTLTSVYRNLQFLSATI